MAIASLLQCQQPCRVDPGSRELLQVVPLFALATSFLVYPLLAHLWGQWWGGKGMLSFAVLGTLAGVGVGTSLHAVHPSAANLWWATAAAGTVAGWELSSHVRERLRAPASDPQGSGAAMDRGASRGTGERAPW